MKTYQFIFSFFFATAVLFFAASPALAHHSLPDLRMAKLQSLQIDNTADSRKLLRFTSIIVNVGDGPFEVIGKRESSESTEMKVIQHLYYGGSGEYDTEDTDAIMYFAGDDHTHWHVRDLTTYVLTNANKKKVKGVGVKRGFCFFDTNPINRSLPNAPQNSVYNDQTTPPACGAESDLEVKMGLSVGWGDEYPHFLSDQYIDITGLKNGKYKLHATADADNWFWETDDWNNNTWVEFKLKGDKITILGYGPSADSE